MEKLTVQQAVLLVWFWLSVLLFSAWMALLFPGPSQHQIPAQDQPKAEAPTDKKPVDVTGSEGSENRLADYTLWLTIFTGVLGAATIGLGVFNYMLWRETRSGRILANKIHSDEERPWLAIEIISATQEFDRTNNGELTIQWQTLNSGKTPAIEIRTYSELVRIGLRPRVDEVFSGFVEGNLSVYRRTQRTGPMARIAFPNSEAGIFRERVMELLPTSPEAVAQRYWMLFMLVYRSAHDPERIFHTAEARFVELIPGDFIAGITIPADQIERETRGMGVNSIA